MNQQQADILLQLTNHPGWKTYVELKQQTLAKLHEQAEWDATGILKVQGQILEIRSDLALQKKVLALLEKK